ncbi:MAG: carbonic anhydrase, partial [Gemmatimonadales bacterium]|nr:carbonic anhydrase [Gemmatimonadales bacterium]
AVDVLRVRHVIVTGHYGCGGIRAALENARLGLVDNWLRHVQDVRERHEPLLAALPDTGARSNRLCELNVVEQVRHVCETSIVQDAWERKQSLAVHGLIYGLDDGRLRDLGTSVAAAEDVSRVYFEAVDGLANDRPARTTARPAPR